MKKIIDADPKVNLLKFFNIYEEGQKKDLVFKHQTVNVKHKYNVNPNESAHTKSL